MPTKMQPYGRERGDWGFGCDCGSCRHHRKHQKRQQRKRARRRLRIGVLAELGSGDTP